MSQLISELNTDDLKQNLELLIDKHGLSYVLSTMAQICYEKSDHIAASYDDKLLSKAWDKAGNRIDTCESNVSKLGV